jgi:hypothetical protein
MSRVRRCDRAAPGSYGRFLAIEVVLREFSAKRDGKSPSGP